MGLIWRNCFYAIVLCASWRCAAAVAQSRWVDEQTIGPVIVHANFSLAAHRPLLDETSRLQADLQEALGIASSREPIHLFLFERSSTYRWYMKEYFPKIPYRRALYIKHRGPGMVFAYQSPEFKIDVRHECTHAFLHASLPMMPLWLDEGLAEYFEVSADKRAFDNPHLKATRWLVRVGNAPRIEDLEAIRELGGMGAGEYRSAWAWTHFMLHGSAEAHDELVRYLADIAAHTPPGQLSERLRRRIPDLERRFVTHFQEWEKPDDGNSDLFPFFTTERTE